MNAASVRAIPESNGFRAEYRPVHRTAWRPVNHGHLFATAAEAKVAAHEALLASLMPVIVGSGHRAELVPANKLRAAAGQLFRPGQKPIPVERR